MMNRIILIDDDPGILDALAALLQREGYEVHCYRDANLIFKGGFVLPSLFFIDRQLTGIDGLDICRYLKTTDATAYIPVIIFSASPYVEQIAYQAGADAFIEKPFTNNAIRAILKKFAGIAET